MRTTPLSCAVDVFKAMGHPARLRMLGMLGSGPLSVCQITAVLGIAPSTVSAHLSELSFAGLLEHERSGRFVICRLAAGEADRVLQAARALLGSDPQIRDDEEHARRLRAHGIRAVDWTDPSLAAEVEADVREPVLVPAGGEGDQT